MYLVQEDVFTDVAICWSYCFGIVKIKVNVWLLFVEWIELLEDNEKKKF